MQAPTATLASSSQPVGHTGPDATLGLHCSSGDLPSCLN
jgi:hypothetical protein